MTLKHDRCRPVPDWLARLDPRELDTSVFLLKQVLEHSLYYPASGVEDGRPVQFLAGFVHSFIYADYGVAESEVDDAIENSPFVGYSAVRRVPLTARDLGLSGWPLWTPPQKVRQFVKKPFATWYIFDREQGRPEDHGPWRFSFIHVCLDGIVAYKALYCQNDTAPEVLTIIQPGTGFGGNWTNFEDPKGRFATTVLHGVSSTIPGYLVCGGHGLDYRQACWPARYPQHVEQHPNGIGVWRRSQNLATSTP